MNEHDQRGGRGEVAGKAGACGLPRQGGGRTFKDSVCPLKSSDITPPAKRAPHKVNRTWETQGKMHPLSGPGWAIRRSDVRRPLAKENWTLRGPFIQNPLELKRKKKP